MDISPILRIMKLRLRKLNDIPKVVQPVSVGETGLV